MKKNLLFGFIIITLLTNCSVSQKLKKSRALLKEYAYCRCYEFTADDSFFLNNEASNGVYFDLASYNPSVFWKIDSIAKQFASQIKPPELADYGNRKAIFFNCFLFYHSKQLDSLVKAMDKDYNGEKDWQ